MTVSKLKTASLGSSLKHPFFVRWVVPIVILWLALFLRVWQLDVLPPGLYYDEGFNGTMARDVLRGNNRPIFFTPNYGEEPLHIYTEAVFFAFLGESPWTIRLVSAVFGVLFVAGLYTCARALFPDSNRIALVATFIAATLYWSINFSRYGIETNGLPMLLTLSAAALARAFRTLQWRWVIGAGFLIGATIYTYLASRVWLLAVALWFIYLVALHRSVVRAHLAGWVLLGGVTVLTLAPLALFFVANPGTFNARSGAVFTPQDIVLNGERVARGFFLIGDSDIKDNLPRRAALDIVLAPLFVTGILLALTRFRKPLYGFLLIWFGVMLLPSILSMSAPNFRRMIGAMPAMILFCALGFDWLWNRVAAFQSSVSGLSSPRPLLARLIPLLMLVALGVSAYWSAHAYFVEWASSPDLFYAFDVGYMQVARALAARPPNEALYLSPYYSEHYTTIWTLDGRPLSAFDGRANVLVLPDAARAATFAVITREDPITLREIEDAYPDAQVLQKTYDLEGNPYATLVDLPANTRTSSPPPAPFQAIRAGEYATLTGAVVSPAAPARGKTIAVKLQWQAGQPTPKNYTTSVRLQGPVNPKDGSTLWAMTAKRPENDFYPTSHWLTGQTILETYTLEIPANAPAGVYDIQVESVSDTGISIPFTMPDGAPLQNNPPVIDTFQLN